MKIKIINFIIFNMENKTRDLINIYLEELKILTPMVLGLGGGVFTLIFSGNFTLQRIIFMLLGIISLIGFAFLWIKRYNTLRQLKRKFEGGKQ